MIKSFIKQVNLYPLYALLLIGFVGLHPFSLQTRISIVIQTDLTKQIVMLTIYAFSFFLLYFNKVTIRSLLKVWWPFIAFLLFALLSFFWSDYPIKVLKDCFNFIGALMVVSLLATVRIHRDSLPTLFLIITTFVNITSAITFFIGYEPALHIGTGRWRGICMHPNYLGIAGLVGFFSSGYFLLRKQKNRLTILLVAVVPSLISLYLSDSVTSIFLVSCMVLFYWVRSLSVLLLPQTLPVLLLNIIVLCSIIWASIGLIAPELIEVDRVLGSFGRDSSFTGRTMLWDLGLRAIKESPLVGWGYDGLMTAQKRSFFGALMYFQLHNGYIDLTVKTGFIGLSLLGIVLYVAIRRVTIMGKHDSELSFFFFLFIGLLMIHNITETSFFVSGNILWLIFSSIFFLSLPEFTQSTTSVNTTI